jgi:hypothetical protein
VFLDVLSEFEPPGILTILAHLMRLPFSIYSLHWELRRWLPVEAYPSHFRSAAARGSAKERIIWALRVLKVSLAVKQKAYRYTNPFELRKFRSQSFHFPLNGLILRSVLIK